VPFFQIRFQEPLFYGKLFPQSCDNKRFQGYLIVLFVIIIVIHLFLFFGPFLFLLFLKIANIHEHFIIRAIGLKYSAMHLIVGDFHLLSVEIKRRSLLPIILIVLELKELSIWTHPRICDLYFNWWFNFKNFLWVCIIMWVWFENALGIFKVRRISHWLQMIKHLMLNGSCSSRVGIYLTRCSWFWVHV